MDPKNTQIKTPLLIFGLVMLLSFEGAFAQDSSRTKNKVISFFHNAYNKWSETKEYPYNRIHLAFAIGRAVKPSGEMFEALSGYKMGCTQDGYFGGLPDQHLKSTDLFSFSIDYNINRKFSVGFTKLPAEHKCFEGGSGKSEYQLNWIVFIPSLETYYGKCVKEELTSYTYMLNTSFILIPRKQLYFLGFELTAGAGTFVNFFDVTTTLTAYDTTRTGDPFSGYQVQYHMDRKQFNEQKTCFGIALNLNANIYLGKYFSFIYKFNTGIGTSMTISEKSLTVKRETAYVPQHKEMLKGFGNSFGISFHFYPSGS